MFVLLTNLTAIALYLLAWSYLLRSLKRASTPQRWVYVSLTGLAVAAHGAGCYRLINTPDGLALQLFAMMSVVFCCVNLIVLFSSLRKPVHNLFLLLFPLATLAIGASLAFTGNANLVSLTLGLASHVLLSITAYSVFIVATFQALFLALQNYRLKHKRTLGQVKLLPPLQTMEALLFEMLWAGQILLTASIISGIAFVDDLFAQHLAHKTVFTIAAWIIYSVLLWGRHKLGWRGYTAIRWTLVGFAMLMLAYFGSKLVLDYIL